MSPKKVDMESRRRQILGAAAEEFAHRGYRQTTIDQVASAAGISKGAVYLSFASKEELFYALFEQLTRDSVDQSTHGADMSSKTAVEQILALFAGMMAAIDANEALTPLMLEFWSACGAHETRERFGTRFAELFGQIRTLLTGLIKDGIKRGELTRGLPAEALASCLMAMIDGLLLQQWTDPRLKASVALKKALPVLLGSLRVAGS